MLLFRTIPRAAGPGRRATQVRQLLALLLLAGAAWRVPQTASALTLPDPAALAGARFVRVDRIGTEIVGVQPLATWPAPEAPAAQLQCRQPLLRQAPAVRGAWIWQTRELLRDPERARSLLQRMADAGLRRMALQLDPGASPADYARLLEQAARRGIDTRALSGEPDDVLHPRQALAVIDWVARFNQQYPEARLRAVEFDIEPYLLPGFEQHRDAMLGAYLQLLARLHRAAAKAGLRLSVVVPFWFADTPWRDGSLLEPVAREVDSLSVMSYRTDAAQREAIANNALCIGELYGKPVRLGLETLRLPLEQHAIIAIDQFPRLLRSRHGSAQLAVPAHELDAVALRHWSDQPQRISYYPDTAGALSASQAPMPYAGFGGWMINGLDTVWGPDAQHP
jgi:hypothetical protein